jgi:hypothetical protein
MFQICPYSMRNIGKNLAHLAPAGVLAANLDLTRAPGDVTARRRGDS